jgi:hypothetical protein
VSYVALRFVVQVQHLHEAVVDHSAPRDCLHPMHAGMSCRADWIGLDQFHGQGGRSSSTCWVKTKQRIGKDEENNCVPRRIYGSKLAEGRR